MGDTEVAMQSSNAQNRNLTVRNAHAGKRKNNRSTFIRAGWFAVTDGRLVNEIFKREFANAQNAFDSFRAKGQRGGKNHGA